MKKFAVSWILSKDSHTSADELFPCSPWDLGQIDIKLGTKHIIYQKLAVLCRKKIPRYQVSSLAYKFEFYRPEQNEKGGPMEWNLTHGSQSVDKKWGHLSDYHVYFRSYNH